MMDELLCTLDELEGGKTDAQENAYYPTSCKDINTDHIHLDPKVKDYGLLDNIEATEKFLLNYPEVIDVPTVLALLEWCSTIREDIKTFNVVSRQCVYIIYLYDLSRYVNMEPVSCVSLFFEKVVEPQYRDRFDKEVFAYRNKIQTLTFKELLKEVLICSTITSPEEESSAISASSSEEVEEEDEEDEEERCSLFLDPVTVYNSLPVQLKEALDDEDMLALQDELFQYPQDRAKYYFVLLLRSGLLIPVEKEAREEDETTNESDIEFDGESKSSNDAELAEYLESVDFEKYAKNSEDADSD